jgi:murein tripeptide amidase MpaA
MTYLILLFLLQVIADDQVLFRNTDTVFRCKPDSKIPFSFFEQFDVWNSRVYKHIDIRIRSAEEMEIFRAKKLNCKILIEDLKSFENKKRDEINAEDHLSFFKSYHDYQVIIDKLDSWSKEYSEIITYIPSIGSTHEGRNIPVLHLTRKNNKPKKKIWFNGGIHAREWISSHVCLYLIDSLLKNQDLLEELEFIVAPLLNPDGYMFSRTSDRWWRKNRRNNGNSFGVDLNRNFDFKWGEGGSSSNPYAETYMGPSAASEPEVQAVQKYVQSLGKVHVGIDFHSYGQLILRPWGYTLQPHPREAEYKLVGDGISSAIYNSGRQTYISQPSAGLYPITGGLDDWLTANNMIGFTIELRDRGLYGFLLPESQIEPTGMEAFAGLKYIAEYVLTKSE